MFWKMISNHNINPNCYNYAWYKYSIRKPFTLYFSLILRTPLPEILCLNITNCYNYHNFCMSAEEAKCGTDTFFSWTGEGKPAQ